MTIRVEARQVLVPLFWGGIIECKQSKNKDFIKCSWDGEINDHVPRTAYLRGELADAADLGFVSPESLRLFEDGKEQNIERIERVAGSAKIASDNLGTHNEGAWVPTGMWSTSDQPAEKFKYPVLGHYYLVAFSPPVSPEGSCHSIRITGPHESQLVYRNEYCNVIHSSSDLLEGTPEEKRLEGFLTAGIQGSIHPRMQVSDFLEVSGKARVDLDVELPFDEVKPKDLKIRTLPIDMLILASEVDGRAVARQSERLLGAPRDFDKDVRINLELLDAMYTRVRYDGQMQLPPGKYKIAFAYSHGPDFGIAAVPLTVGNYDGSQFAISSIALCKRVRKAGEKAVAKEFVPLAAGGDEFTPAGDTDFRNGDTLMAYFELYEPLPEQSQHTLHLNYTMRIRNEQTGAVALQRVENADSWIQPGKSTIPIAEKLVLSQLHLAPGKYRFEIQATDSASRSTLSRTAEFWID